MIKNIFYSWQSDLPNSENRGFLGDCLKKAIKVLNKNLSFGIDFNLDRDTKDEIGTPDIVNTIFDKIEKSSVFCADISIINVGTEGRKTPNPNVLVELGYAAKVLGWERIICFYNLDHGKIEDLPFDLKFRRPLTYSLVGQTKTVVRENLTKQLEYALLGIGRSNNLNDDIFEYVKVRIDNEILTLLSILIKIVLGYDPGGITLSTYKRLMNMETRTLKERLELQEYLGFQIFKNLDRLSKNFERLLDNPLTLNTLSKQQLRPLTQYLQNLNHFENMQNWRHIPDMYLPLKKKSTQFIVQNAAMMNPVNEKNGFLLLRKLHGEAFKVTDSGDFYETVKINNLLDVFIINPSHLDLYVDAVTEFIRITESWLDQTGGEFLIDNKFIKVTPHDFTRS